MTLAPTIVMAKVKMTQLSGLHTKPKSQPSVSGCDLERRSSKMSAL